MIENLIISLLLMFVSGITFIAYKHPDLFEEKFHNKILFAAAIILLGTVIYDFAINQAFDSLYELIQQDKVGQIKEIKDSLKSPISLQGMAVALWAYNFFLLWLSYHMKRSSK